MVSTAFLLDVIVFGLIAAVVFPVIDLILFSMRSRREPGYTPFDFSLEAGRAPRADAELSARRPTGPQRKADSRGSAAPKVRNFVGKGDGRRPAHTSGRPELAGRLMGARPTTAARLPKAVADVSTTSSDEHLETRTGAGSSPAVADERPLAPVGYVASNGIVVTPSIGIFKEMTETASAQSVGALNPACHPPHFAAIADASIAPMTALPAGHPHSEYWRYGSAHFYESI